MESHRRGGDSAKFGYKLKFAGAIVSVIAALMIKTSGDCICPSQWTWEYSTHEFCGMELQGSSCHSESIYNCSLSNNKAAAVYNCTTQALRSRPYCFIPVASDCMMRFDGEATDRVGSACMIGRSCVGVRKAKKYALAREKAKKNQTKHSKN
jgi:hypothetical protein